MTFSKSWSHLALAASICSVFACNDHPVEHAGTTPSPTIVAEHTTAVPAQPSSGTQTFQWAPSGNAATAPGASVAPTAGTSGTVRETMNSGGYTYVRLDTATGSQWAATTETPVAVGDQIEIAGGNEMPGFHSRTLNRTFDQITFASAFHVIGRNGAPVAAGAPSALPAGHPAMDPSATAAPGAGALPPGHPPLDPSAAMAAPSAGALPPGHPPLDPSAAGAQPAAAGATASSRGVVQETMNAGGYTYMRLLTSSGSVWIAATEMQVTVGAQVEYAGGTEMPGFHSRTLNRTFDQIVFAGSAHVVGAGAAPATAMPAGHPGMGARPLPPGHPPLNAAPSAT